MQCKFDGVIYPPPLRCPVRIVQIALPAWGFLTFKSLYGTVTT